MPALVDLLGRSAKAAYPFLRGLAVSKTTEGKYLYSANEALDKLKEQFQPIRRDTGLTIIRVLREKADINDIVKLIGENTPIPEESHTLNPTKQTSRFLYVLNTDSVNPLIPDTIAVTSDTELSQNEIFNLGTIALNRYGSEVGETDILSETTLSLNTAFIRPGEL